MSHVVKLYFTREITLINCRVELYILLHNVLVYPTLQMFIYYFSRSSSSGFWSYTEWFTLHVEGKNTVHDWLHLFGYAL